MCFLKILIVYKVDAFSPNGLVNSLASNQLWKEVGEGSLLR